jgi:putative transposase of IS4/5 family DUF4096
VVSGIIYVIGNGLRWQDAPAVYGPHKTLYNRFVRWSRMGIFDRILANRAAENSPPDCAMIDSTHLKSHRTAKCWWPSEDLNVLNQGLLFLRRERQFPCACRDEPFPFQRFDGAFVSPLRVQG